MLQFNQKWPGSSLINFIHNWRCAGTSLNSILSANYQDHYLKIGHPFNMFGWPEDYKNHSKPILSLGCIKSRIPIGMSSDYIVGGHTFLGLESLIPGPADIWMNYREPVSRLNSGILRFYNRTPKPIDNKSNHLFHAGTTYAVDFKSPESIDHLLKTELLRESNGMSRRLAAFSLSQSLSIDNFSNVETIDILTSSEYNKQDLRDAALANLPKIKIIINSQHLQASLLCIEKTYNLSSPLINPFSNLKHNPFTLSGASKCESNLLDYCSKILESHSDVDRTLYLHLNELFVAQVNRLNIDAKQIKVREYIHEEGIFHPKWFLTQYTDRKKCLEYVGESIYALCSKYNGLSDEIYSTFLSWDVFDSSFKLDLARYCSDKYSLKTNFL